MQIDRRALLRGAGGVAIALPFLEAMLPRRAWSATPPKRYLVCFVGTSLGQSTRDLFVPDGVGPGYTPKTALLPLMTLGVRDEVSVVSGMKIPWDTGAGIPPGGRPRGFHASTVGPLTSGMQSTSSDPRPRGPTSEQIVGDAIGRDTRFKTLEFRVQPVTYRGGGYKGYMSARRDASGRVVLVEPTVSPRVAFENIFAGFKPAAGGDPELLKERMRRLAEDQSVLDQVLGSAERLRTRLGTADRQRLAQHFDALRDIERQLVAIPSDVVGMACTPPPHPGEDPSTTTNGQIGYSDEDKRGKVIGDLIHMAFACDLTRSVAWMLTFSQCFMNVQPIVGVTTDFHELGHYASTLENMSRAIGWSVGLFARLVAKLRDTREGTGTMLDSTALVFLPEGGRGLDPSTGAISAHSSENMAALIAGRVGGLEPGKHVVAKDAHPGTVVVSAMKAVDAIQNETLGEVKGTIPGLFA